MELLRKLLNETNVNIDKMNEMLPNRKSRIVLKASSINGANEIVSGILQYKCVKYYFYKDHKFEVYNIEKV